MPVEPSFKLCSHSEHSVKAYADSGTHTHTHTHTHNTTQHTRIYELQTQGDQLLWYFWTISGHHKGEPEYWGIFTRMTCM